MALEIDFMDAVNGTSRQVSYARTNKCGTCNGTKMKPGTSEMECGICDGTGFQTQQFGHTIVQSTCSACGGGGKSFQSCISCNGTGTQHTQVTETVTIPRGVDSGVNLRMSKKGNFSLRGEPGDLLIKVTVKEHPTFKREGSDIITERPITFSQAALGATLRVETLWGKQEVKVKPGTGSEEQVVLPGQGVNRLPPN